MRIGNGTIPHYYTDVMRKVSIKGGKNHFFISSVVIPHHLRTPMPLLLLITKKKNEILLYVHSDYNHAIRHFRGETCNFYLFFFSVLHDIPANLWY